MTPAPGCGWYHGGEHPTEADVCPHCNDLVEYFWEYAGLEKDGQRLHRRCYWKHRGFEEIEDGPRCSNCWGEFNLKRTRDVPLPDKDGELTEWRCTDCRDYKVNIDCESDELTDADIAWLEGVLDTEHWFADAAKLVVWNYRETMEGTQFND